MRRSASFLGICLVLLAACGAEGGGDPAPPVGTEVGERAPELRGTTSAGEPFSLADERGAPLVLEFYPGAYCGLCRERLLRLQQHLPAYRELGARVVALTADDPARGQELARQLGLGFPLVTVDTATLSGWGVAAEEGSGVRPGTFLLDREGVVIFRHVGRTAADRVSDAGMITILERRNRE